MVFFLVLIALTSLGIVYHFSVLSVASFLLIVGAAIGSDFIFLRLRHEPYFQLYAAIVSGLIISLLSAPDHIIQGVVAATIAMASKNYIRTKKHIFNPAAFGLFLSGLLFQTHISWWGVSFQHPSTQPGMLLLFVILLLPGITSAFVMKRYPIILTFWAIYIFTTILFSFLQQSPLNFETMNLNAILFFFSFVMLPEPMTTPYKRLPEILFGACVALLYVGLRYPAIAGYTSFFPDTLLFSLLVGNLVFFRSTL